MPCSPLLTGVSGQAMWHRRCMPEGFLPSCCTVGFAHELRGLLQHQHSCRDCDIAIHQEARLCIQYLQHRTLCFKQPGEMFRTVLYQHFTFCGR